MCIIIIILKQREFQTAENESRENGMQTNELHRQKKTETPLTAVDLLINWLLDSFVSFVLCSLFFSWNLFALNMKMKRERERRENETQHVETGLLSLFLFALFHIPVAHTWSFVLHVPADVFSFCLLLLLLLRLLHFICYICWLCAMWTMRVCTSICSRRRKANIQINSKNWIIFD